MASTEEWVSSDDEIFQYDFKDNFIWIPSIFVNYYFINNFEVCTPQTGRINSGEVSHTFINDNNKLILDEFNETPGFCYLFQHWNLPDPTTPYTLFFRGTYGGDDSHIVKFQLYDWDSTTYIDFFTLSNSTFTQDYIKNLPTGSQYFTTIGVNTNVIQIRVIHTSAGNDGHLFRCNYWKVDQGSI